MQCKALPVLLVALTHWTRRQADSDALTQRTCTQGASTIVWACVAEELEGKSGSYLQVRRAG